MRRCRGAGLAALAAVLLVAAVRAQIQQAPRLETTEGTSISIKCSHANIRTGDFIHFYRQLPGRRPELLAVTARAPKDLRAPEGRLWVSANRQSSELLLRRPRRGDAAVYYCALGDTGRGAGAAAGHEPPRAGPGGAGGTAPAAASRGRCRSARRARLAPLLPGSRGASDTDTGNRTNTDTNSDTDSDTDSDTNSSAGTVTDTDSGTDTDTGSDNSKLESSITLNPS